MKKINKFIAIMLIIVLTLLFLCVFRSDTKAEVTTSNILYIGNSKTYYNMLPNMYRQLTIASGKTDAKFKAVTAGGRKLEEHATKLEAIHNSDGTVRSLSQALNYVKSKNSSYNLIQDEYDAYVGAFNQKWSYIVLQEQTTNSKDKDLMLNPAKRIISVLKKYGKNSDFKIVYYAGNTTLPNDGSLSKYNDEQMKVNKVAKEVASETGGIVSYSGQAFYNYIKKYPNKEIYKNNSEYPNDMFIADRGHPTQAGTYLAACCLYATIYGESPVGINYTGAVSDDPSNPILNLGYPKSSTTNGLNSPSRKKLSELSSSEIRNLQIIAENTIIKKAPQITLSKNDINWTNSDISLNAKVTRSAFELDSNAYSWNNNTSWTTNTTYTVSKNGTYTVYVRDSMGNSASAKVSVTNIDKTPPTIKTSTTAVSQGTKITATATDSESGISTYSWDNKSTWTTNNTYTVTSGGTYVVYAKDRAGNIASKTVTIGSSDTTAPTVSDLTYTPTSYTNQYVVITANASDSESETLLYSWDNKSTWVSKNTYKVTSNGTYKVYVKDSSGNITSKSITISNIDKSAPTISTSMETVSQGIRISVNATDSGAGIYGYSWDNQASWVSTNTYLATQKGTYTVYVKDRVGNIASESVSVVIQTGTPDTNAPVISSLEYSPTSYTNKNVVITVNACDMGNGIAGYSWDNKLTWTTDKTHTVTANGTYTVYVKDYSGNTSYESITISNIDKTVPIINTSTEKTSQGVVIKVNASDSQSGVLGYSWDNQASWTISDTYIAKTSGVYTVYVRDRVGNIASKDVSVGIIDTEAPTINDLTYTPMWYTNENVVITVNASDFSNGTLEYSWNNKSTWIRENTYEVSANGTYTVYVKDEAGNISNKSITISNIDKTAPTMELSLETLDYGVQINVSATDLESGIYAYSWDNQEMWVTNDSYLAITSGTYTVYVKDNVGNVASKSINVDVPDRTAPTISSLTYTPIETTTQNVIITVTAHDSDSGIEGYSWDNKFTWTLDNTHTVSENGTYAVYVKDKAGNISCRSVTISNIDNKAPLISSLIHSPSGQTNQDIVITVHAIEVGTGIAGYSWDDKLTWTTENTYTVSENGTYTVYVKDALGNTSSKSITISNIDRIEPTINTSLEYLLQGIRITASATDLESEIVGYSWNNQESWTSARTYIATTSGTYTVYAKDRAGNIASKSIEINLDDDTAPTIENLTYTPTEITNENVVITVNATDSGTGISKYSWNNKLTWTTNNSYTVTSNGTYTVYVKDNVGNIAKESITINNIDNIGPTISRLTYSPTEPTNNDVVITAVATDSGIGLSEYSWDNQETWTTNNTYTVSENGTYTVYAKDRLGNISYREIIISNIDKTAPEINYLIYSPTEITNEDVTITTNATDLGLGISSYSWNNQETWTTNKTYTVSKNGTYTVYVKDKAGNITENNITITNIDKAGTTINNVTYSPTEITNQDVVITVNTISDSGTVEYSWDNKTTWSRENTHTVTSNGTYTVYVRDTDGNISEKSIEITNIDKTAPIINSLTQDPTETTSQSVKITVNASDAETEIVGYSWDNKETWITENTYTVRANGTYTVYVKDEAGNISEKSITINNIRGEDLEISSTKYEINGRCISYIKPNTTINNVKNNIQTNKNYKILNKNNEEVLDDNKLIGTGYKLEFETGETFEISVVGDLNGDGKVTAADLTAMNKHIVGLQILVGPFEKAADTNIDGKVTASDLTKLNKVIVGILEL